MKTVLFESARLNNMGKTNQPNRIDLTLRPFCNRTTSIVACVALAMTSMNAVAKQIPGGSQEGAASSATLSLADVAKLAAQRNGTFLSSVDSYLSTKEGITQAFAQFLPTITPSYIYTSERSSSYQGGQTVFNQLEGGTSAISANWQLLDLGERDLNYQSAKHSAESAKQNAIQTLRQVLFNAENQYYETLRSQELKKVSQAQVDRALAIYDQTKLNIEKGGAAKVAIYQVEADLDNAKVSLLQSQNAISTSSASLKSLIGYPAQRLLPTLVPLAEPIQKQELTTLNSYLALGVKTRPDLISLRENISSQDYNRRLQDRRASIGLTLSASFNETLTPHTLQDRLLTLTASYPLFDGGASRSVARSAGYQEDASKRSYDQAVSDAKAQIESAYLTESQDAVRLDAASKANEAATINYQSVYESFHLGSSSLLDVLTAQVSQVTAQSNYIQAVYDYAEADLNLRLSVGLPLPEETAVRLP